MISRINFQLKTSTANINKQLNMFYLDSHSLIENLCCTKNSVIIQMEHLSHDTKL